MQVDFDLNLEIQVTRIRIDGGILGALGGCHALVTGGAGFIGSHLVDKLMLRGLHVTVLDNLSNGRLENMDRWLGNRNFKFMKGDLLDMGALAEVVQGCEAVYHLVANPEVRLGTIHPEAHYEQNVRTTFNLLEAIRKVGSVKKLLFTSTSTVYGEATEIPTPEDYAPLKPISVYGSSKLACEALVMGHSYTYGFKAVICRLANIIGSRSTHGVIHDFIQKLRRNPKELEVLGDGTQTKSYLFVDDCIEGICVALERFQEQVDVFNIGSEDQMDVKTIANTVVEEMGLKDVRLRFTGGVDGGRGWVGDVKSMLLETSKLKSRGWTPKYNSEQSIRLTVRGLLSEGL